MKKYSFFKFFALIISLVALQFFTTQINAQPIQITMTVDFDEWVKNDESTWYDATEFEASSNPGQSAKGRIFKTDVKKNQKLTWIPNGINNNAQDSTDYKAEVILINVSRSPNDGGAFLLNELWYDAEYDNSRQKYIVKGRTKKTGFPPEGAEERYIITFAVLYEDESYDFYTIDPIIRGSE